MDEVSDRTMVSNAGSRMAKFTPFPSALYCPEQGGASEGTKFKEAPNDSVTKINNTLM